eukprot:scaffold1888_cov79-Isochrysis_galbana.AAC.1
MPSRSTSPGAALRRRACTWPRDPSRSGGQAPLAHAIAFAACSAYCAASRRRTRAVWRSCWRVPSEKRSAVAASVMQPPRQKASRLFWSSGSGSGGVSPVEGGWEWEAWGETRVPAEEAAAGAPCCLSRSRGDARRERTNATAAAGSRDDTPRAKGRPRPPPGGAAPPLPPLSRSSPDEQASVSEPRDEAPADSEPDNPSALSKDAHDAEALGFKDWAGDGGSSAGKPARPDAAASAPIASSGSLAIKQAVAASQQSAVLSA